MDQQLGVMNVALRRFFTLLPSEATFMTPFGFNSPGPRPWATALKDALDDTMTAEHKEGVAIATPSSLPKRAGVLADLLFDHAVLGRRAVIVDARLQFR